MRSTNYTLTAAKLNAARGQEKPYKLADGGGLFVRVSSAGTRTWCYGYVAPSGKRSEVTFGQFPEVGIKAARDLHFAARQQLAAGVDPSAAKKADREEKRRAAMADDGLFKTFSEKWLTEQLGDATAPYQRKMRSLLERFVWPSIGRTSLADVKPYQILEIIEGQALKAIPGTAEKVRALVQQVFDHAIRTLRVEKGANPAAAMTGVIKVPPSKHHRHLTEPELGVFWRAIAGQVDGAAHPSTVAAARIIALTLCRKTEALKAEWTEFDLKKGSWTIPAERTKMRKPHRVFLSRQAVAILEAQYALTGDGRWAFTTSSKLSVPISPATMTFFFKRLKDVPSDFTPHGLRGTGATILREHGFRRDVVELLLAHTEKGVAGAYHHHELVEERREALQFYADLIGKLAASEKVSVLKTRRAKAA
ncbi:integrase [Paraburkholderia sp. BL6669N2]|uniref:tyrosine-type recombinase/integrase n=1 Tax=Paraburkholderia sp. BL6669N2 TaxID=1938807 RepID=UPI000E24F0CB|nr:integrase arm-type DNA-binding domain-containing protein [Paraburkholderia sp. BL6669N2]REG57612.1 integrase [Paraburkholderia sp. BL6669N2]